MGDTATHTTATTAGGSAHEPHPPRGHRHRHRLGVVFGGGGAVGIAWHLGVIDALERAGLPVTDAPLIGTSAGAWACAAARLRLGFEEFASLGDIEVPDRRPGLLHDLATDLLGDATAVGVRISAVAIPAMRRHLLHGHEHRLADLIAASSAVPGVFSPHRIGTTTYIDGGIRSMASAQDAEPSEILVASLPIGGPLFGPVGHAMEHATRRALARWRHHHGGTTIVLRPGRRFVEAVGHRPRALMDVELARRVYPIAYDTAARRLDRRLELQFVG